MNLTQIQIAFVFIWVEQPHIWFHLHGDDDDELL